MPAAYIRGAVITPVQSFNNGFTYHPYRSLKFAQGPFFCETPPMVRHHAERLEYGLLVIVVSMLFSIIPIYWG